jgi:putative Ca2+/H+ antiporter (TMEM165/GDT1 family)
MIRAFFTVFVTVFLAEVGDKTQLATMLFASKGDTSRWLVFAAASAALVLAAAIGVLVGSELERFISPRTLRIVAGLGFIAIGAWTMLTKG